MATQVIPRRIRVATFLRSRTFWENLTLRRFHPRALFIEIAGTVWIFYFLWNHEIFLAITFWIFSRIIALTAVWDVDPDQISRTTWGRVALLHVEPGNMISQLAGLVFLIVGLWNHVTGYILIGTSFICLGHAFGWSKVNPSFGENLDNWKT